MGFVYFVFFVGLSTTFFVLGRTASVMQRDEQCGDREQVVGEVVLVVAIVALTVNHEFNASFLKDEFQELASNSRESVSVHNGNFRDHSSEHVFQKGLQAFSMKIDPGTDIVDDFKSRVRFLEFLDLTFEISSLLDAADSCVNVRLFIGGLLTEHREHSVDVVHPFSSGQSDVIEASGGRPCTQGSGRNAILV